MIQLSHGRLAFLHECLGQSLIGHLEMCLDNYNRPGSDTSTQGTTRTDTDHCGAEEICSALAQNM